MFLGIIAPAVGGENRLSADRLKKTHGGFSQ